MGIFNPLIGHRQQRVLRRHMTLLDFLARAAGSHMQWTPAADQRERQHAQAFNRWFQSSP